MKICPKCNEILGDSVKVCFKCKYEFDLGKLQEDLDQKDRIQQIAYEQTQKRNKKEKFVTLTILSIFLTGCLSLAIFSLIFGVYIYRGNGRFRVSSSLLVPYEYYVTPDYVILEKYCGKGREVDIPANLWGRPVTYIGECCFAGNKNVVKVRIPKTITYISYATFSGCTSLGEVIGEGDVERVDDCAFHYCSALTTVNLGTKIRYIGYDAFAECVQLKQFAKQDRLRHIGHDAFADSGLEEFEFNIGAEIEVDAFLNTPWLAGKTFLISDYDDLVCYNGPEGKIVIPDGVETMWSECFVGLKDSEIFIPQTVQKIPKGCFVDCTNIKIYIPSSVEMAKGFFDNCSNVTIVTTMYSYAEGYAKTYKIPYEIVESW